MGNSKLLHPVITKPRVVACASFLRNNNAPSRQGSAHFPPNPAIPPSAGIFMRNSDNMLYSEDFSTGNFRCSSSEIPLAFDLLPRLLEFESNPGRMRVMRGLGGK